jgi:hypothetical protein
MSTLPTDFFTPPANLIHDWSMQVGVPTTPEQEQEFSNLLRLTIWRKIGMTCSRAGAGCDKLFPVSQIREEMIGRFDNIADQHIKIVDAFIDWLKTVGEYKAAWGTIKYNSCANDIEFIPREKGNTNG